MKLHMMFAIMETVSWLLQRKDTYMTMGRSYAQPCPLRPLSLATDQPKM